MGWLRGFKRNATDAYFSDYIRERADWKCEYPGCFKDFSDHHQGLECSHFVSRGNKNTRWDESNAAAFCHYHHDVMGKNPADHYLFFEKRLGKKWLDSLLIRSKLSFKGNDEQEIRMGLRLMLKKMAKEKKSKIIGAR